LKCILARESCPGEDIWMNTFASHAVIPVDDARL